ncbi:MAG: iron-containing alcohol dehydrogenase [Candidatus Dormibacteraeota bacterium]|nr:iron-containing alcohol dehydrogenase [Candidatus Dormibacteraeota bacterium]
MTYGPDLQFAWKVSTRVVFGAGHVKRLGKEARLLGGSRAMLVTDPFLGSQVHIAGAAADSLREAGLAVALFAEVEADPSVENINRGVEAARAFKPDLFVGLGGGSSMDAAKAIDMLYVCGDELLDHEGVNTVKQPLHPVIAVPTTAGTGAETSFAAVISDRARERKVPLAEEAFLPAVAILDPELTVGLPARLTAATGMDAHAHALDVLHSTRRQPFNDALAHHVLRTVHRHLRRATAQPDDIVARGQMLAAACSMGFSLSTTPYGVIHALGHPLGAHFSAHHGICVALLSCPAMEWNLDECAAIYAEAARAAGLASEADGERLAAERLVAATDQMMQDLALPRRLSELGVEAPALPALARDAAADIGARFNLRRGDEVALHGVYRAVL